MWTVRTDMEARACDLALYIIEHEATVRAAARRFGVSVSYLSHEFARYTDRSVYDYILYRRVMLARQMMPSDLTLNTIAYQCGFNDYSNFLRVFNRLVGMPPSRYRKNLRRFQQDMLAERQR